MEQNLKPTSSGFLLVRTEQDAHDFVDDLVRKLEENYNNKTLITRNKETITQQILQSVSKYHESKEDLAKEITDILRKIIKDKHLGLRLENTLSADEKNMNRLSWMESVRYGIESAKIENGIGYLKLTHFVWPRKFNLAKQSAPMLKKYVFDALTQVNDAKALIIDLRDNEGGSPEMVAAIASFILDPGIILNEFRWRDPQGRIYQGLKNSPEPFDQSPVVLLKHENEVTTEQFKTIDEEILFGLKSKLKHAPVAVLVNSKTFSAGEEFPYDLKQLKRALIIGETTAGGANPWQPLSLNFGFEFLIPNGEAINPISKTNWEGKGVEPEIIVSSDMALSEAIKRLSNQIK
jgi:C-terminal processing protease CtpA/Prc